MAQTTRISVTGMTCGGCEQAVTRALGRVPGVTAVTASHVEQEVVVTYDEAVVTPDRIRDSITALGYTAA